MKIVIKESANKKGFRLIVPYHMLVNLAVRKSWFRMGLRHGGGDNSASQSKNYDNEKVLQYIDALDFGELREALHGLSLKRGLVLVEIHSSDGAHIKIET